MAEISNSTGFGKHFLSLLGQSSSFNTAYNIAQVALTWYIFTLTGSAVIVGLAAIVESVAVLIVSLPVGAIVDRSNKGFLIFISGIFGFIAMLSLTGIAFYRSFNLYFILGIAALWGISREISRSTSFSSLPDLVSRAIQSRVNGIYRAVNSTMGSVANALAGGIIVVFGIVASFSISTAAYLISAAFSFIFLFPFYRSRPPTRDKSAERAESMVKELKEGFHWLVSRKGFFLLTLSATFFNFFMSMTFTYFVVYVARGLFADSLIYGLLLAVFAAGDVAGSLIPGRVDLLRHTGKINIVIFGGVDGLCILLMGFFPSVYVALPLGFIIGLGIGISVNLWLTSAHNLVPDDMRGRYYALDGVLTSFNPASIAAGAFLIAASGVLWDFIFSGVMMLVFTLVFGLMKSFWNLDGRASPETVGFN